MALVQSITGNGSAGTPGGGGGNMGWPFIARTKKNKPVEIIFFIAIIMWTQQGLNLRPPDYESGALTN